MTRMTLLRRCRLCLSLLCTTLAAAPLLAEEPPASLPQEVAKIEAGWKTECESALAKVSEALDQASKTGQLPGDLAGYYRDCLASFQGGPTGLADRTRIYFPPHLEAT